MVLTKEFDDNHQTENPQNMDTMQILALIVTLGLITSLSEMEHSYDLSERMSYDTTSINHRYNVSLRNETLTVWGMNTPILGNSVMSDIELYDTTKLYVFNALERNDSLFMVLDGPSVFPASCFEPVSETEFYNTYSNWYQVQVDNLLHDVDDAPYTATLQNDSDVIYYIRDLTTNLLYIDNAIIRGSHFSIGDIYVGLPLEHLNKIIPLKIDFTKFYYIAFINPFFMDMSHRQYVENILPHIKNYHSSFSSDCIMILLTDRTCIREIWIGKNLDRPSFIY